MIKKMCLFLTIFLLLITVSACGNESWGFGNYTFKHIHCTTTNECYTIIKWHDNEMGIEVLTEEYGSMYFSEGTYILLEDKCPVCGD